MKRVFFLEFLALSGALAGKEITLLNVSYDRTREFYAEFDESFAKNGKEKIRDTVTGGSVARRYFGDGGIFDLLYQPVEPPR